MIVWSRVGGSLLCSGGHWTQYVEHAAPDGSGNDLLVTFSDGEPTARVNSSNALGQLPRVESKNGGRYRVGDYIIQGSTERAYVTHVDKPGSALITPAEIFLSAEQNG